MRLPLPLAVGLADSSVNFESADSDVVISTSLDCVSVGTLVLIASSSTEALSSAEGLHFCQ